MTLLILISLLFLIWRTASFNLPNLVPSKNTTNTRNHQKTCRNYLNSQFIPPLTNIILEYIAPYPKGTIFCLNENYKIIMRDRNLIFPNNYSFWKIETFCFHRSLYDCTQLYASVIRDLEDLEVAPDISKCVIAPTLSKKKKRRELHENIVSLYDSTKSYTSYRYTGDDDYMISLL
jgi:hypothetical protein